ncbi:MAG: hypothetical protein L0G48_12230, partial [Staphylococcus equorum]|nr:hypothetical protein [Staphylococcus equorum]MDN6850909.1 hypothetical protein [Staphylococcus equorum]
KVKSKNFLNSPFKLQGIGQLPIPLRLVWRVSASVSIPYTHIATLIPLPLTHNLLSFTYT